MTNAIPVLANTQSVAIPENVTLPFPVFTPEQLANLDHDDYSLRLNVIIWFLVSISACFLFLRVYCKIYRSRGLWWDDHVLIASWVSLVVHCSVTSASTTLGFGKHGWDIPLENFSQLVLFANVGGTFSIVSAVWSKTSFALTLLRISQGWTKITIWVVIITVNVLMGLAALFIWIQCTPVERGWNPFIVGSCYPLERIVQYNMLSASYSAAMDILLALLPWKLVWSLQLKKKEKIGVAVAMSMGIFAGLTAIVKVTQTPRMLSGDIYDGIQLVIWSAVESAVTIVAASVPILRTLLKARAPAPRQQQVPYVKSSETDDFGLQSRSTVTIQSLSRSSKRSSHWRLSRQGHMFSRQSSFDANWQHPTIGEILQVKEVDVEYEERNEAEKAREESLKRLHSPSVSGPNSGDNIIYGHGMGNWT